MEPQNAHRKQPGNTPAANGSGRPGGQRPRRPDASDTMEFQPVAPPKQRRLTPRRIAVALALCLVAAGLLIAARWLNPPAENQPAENGGQGAPPATVLSGTAQPNEKDTAWAEQPSSSALSAAAGTSQTDGFDALPAVVVGGFLLLVAALCFFAIRRMFRSSRFQNSSIFPLPGDAKPSPGEKPAQSPSSEEEGTPPRDPPPAE